MKQMMFQPLMLMIALVVGADAAPATAGDENADATDIAVTTNGGAQLSANVHVSLPSVPKPRMQVVATSSGFKTGINGTDAFDEFSINNGQCVYKNGRIIESGGAGDRAATADEMAQVAAFQRKLEEFGTVMQEHMRDYMTALARNGFKEPKGARDGWPLAPTAPCLCAKCVAQK